MVLAIKIKDEIHISESKARGISFQLDYFEAQHLIKDIFKSVEDTKFEFFVNKILDNFNLNPELITNAYNLYYLADSKLIAKSLLDTHQINTNLTTSGGNISEDKKIPFTNYLNYFGFNIKIFPTKLQFLILNILRKKNIIEGYWIEGEAFIPKTTLPIPNGMTPSSPVNNQEFLLNQYEKDLKFNELKNRGKGAKVIIFEQSATDDLSTITGYTSHLDSLNNRNSIVSTVGNFESDIDIEHQMKTLITMFAQKNGLMNQEDFQLNGLCPDAELIIASVKPVPNDDYMGKIRKILVELGGMDIQNAILLFEFETTIFDSKNKTIPKTSLPLSVYKDINKQLGDLALKKNFIIIEGAGNIGINFDEANKLKETIWKIDHAHYNNLSLNNPYLMMIGATRRDINGVFQYIDTNKSDNLDAYMYTAYKVFGKDDSEVPFGGTSGAVAVTAGIVTYLQGRAIQEMTNSNLDGLLDERTRIKTPFTIKVIKKAFESTFKKNLKNGIILTPTTIELLWDECKKEALKHQ